jgi:hypothetical protein
MCGQTKVRTHLWEGAYQDILHDFQLCEAHMGKHVLHRWVDIHGIYSKELAVPKVTGSCRIYIQDADD